MAEALEDEGLSQEAAARLLSTRARRWSMGGGEAEPRLRECPRIREVFGPHR